jgi:hypothetical protein
MNVFNASLGDNGCRPVSFFVDHGFITPGVHARVYAHEGCETKFVVDKKRQYFTDFRFCDIYIFNWMASFLEQLDAIRKTCLGDVYGNMCTSKNKQHNPEAVSREAEGASRYASTISQARPQVTSCIPVRGV